MKVSQVFVTATSLYAALLTPIVAFAHAGLTDYFIYGGDPEGVLKDFSKETGEIFLQFIWFWLSVWLIFYGYIQNKKTKPLTGHTLQERLKNLYLLILNKAFALGVSSLILLLIKVYIYGLLHWAYL